MPMRLGDQGGEEFGIRGRPRFPRDRLTSLGLKGSLLRPPGAAVGGIKLIDAHELRDLADLGSGEWLLPLEARQTEQARYSAWP